MKKTSLFLVILAMIAALFGCDANFQLRGATYTSTDTNNFGTQQVTMEFSKNDTGKITSIFETNPGEVNSDQTFLADFSWAADGNIVTITGSSYTYIYSVEGDPTSMTTQYDTPFSITATLEKKGLTISYPADSEFPFTFIWCFFGTTYGKWTSENDQAYDTEFDKWSPFTVNLSKN